MAFNTGLEDCLTATAPIAERTWLGVGGAADWLAQPTSPEQLAAVVNRCRDEGLAARMLGGGSNLLVRSDGVSGVVILLEHDAFRQVSFEGELARVGGGAPLATAINETVRSGLAGLDPLVGIPGVVGAALHQNSGGRGGDIGQWVENATVLTRGGELLTRSRDEMVFNYRQSSLDELVVLDVTFRLEPANPTELTKRMQKAWIVSKANQPAPTERTAQVFRNPRGMSAGMLIDQAGLKGHSVGGAEVSRKHANYVIAGEGATSDDLLKLIDTVRQRVHERMGIELELSLEIW